jgi:hypothetical protein
MEMVYVWIPLHFNWRFTCHSLHDTHRALHSDLPQSYEKFGIVIRGGACNHALRFPLASANLL